MADSIAQLFLENFRAHREERAYRQRRGYRTESFTYGEILQMACNFARTLEKLGIAKGERVMLWERTAQNGLQCFSGVR